MPVGTTTVFAWYAGVSRGTRHHYEGAAARWQGPAARHTGPMRVDVSGPIVEWRGPAPYHFVVVPDDEADRIAHVAAAVTYPTVQTTPFCRPMHLK